MKSEYINCKNCKDDCRCRGKNITPICVSFTPAKTTNADRIRTMTDEELAELLTTVAKHSADKLCESLKTVDVDLSNCDFDILHKAHLSWLKQSVEEGE